MGIPPVIIALLAGFGPGVSEVDETGEWKQDPLPSRGRLDEAPSFFCPPADGEPWRYAPGDDPTRAEPDHDDRGWIEAPPMFRAENPPPGWSGIGWFRRKVRFPGRAGEVVGVFVTRLGAYELYVDGRPVVASGFGNGPPRPAISPFGELAATFVLPRDQVILAMRLATPSSGEAWIGAWVELCDPVAASSTTHDRSTLLFLVYGAFIGSTLASGILHLFLFVVVRSNGAGHVDYAAFNFSASLLAAAIVARSVGGDYEIIWLWIAAFKAGVILVGVFSVRFFAVSVYGPTSALRSWVLRLAAPFLIATPWLSIQLAYAIAFIALLVDAWLVVALMRRKRHERYAILGGVWALVLACTLQLAPELFGRGRTYEMAFIPGFAVLLLAMAWHLARSVGRTQAALAGQVTEVERLSAERLDDQRRVQEAALARLALEAENRQQRERLEEANRRAALLGELEIAHRELRDTQTQLLQSEKMASLGQLVAGVAHEMNTPIGAIASVHGSLEKAVERLTQRLEELSPGSAKDRKLSAALTVLRDASQVVGRGSERVSEIVRRLRTFARLDEAELQRADLHEGLEDSLRLARHQLGAGIEVVTDYEEIPDITCRPGQLNQVFLNLIVNAGQAMGEYGKLTIRTRRRDRGVEIRFEDSGPGIRPEHLGRVFDPGFTTKGVGVGTGLGLAICYRIVEAHRGALRVDSELGHGARFSVWLPERPEPPGDRHDG